jgi:hypothetical protein
MRVTLTAIVLMVLQASASDAATKSLKGRYALSGSSGCLNSVTMQGGVPVNPSGFTAALVANGNSFTNDHAIEGVVSFNADGTGSVSGATVNDSFGNSNPAANADTFQFAFTYTIAADGTVALQIGTYTGTLTAGPRTGQTFTITNAPVLAGHLAKKALTLAVQQPQVETITYSNADAHDRVCHRAYALIFIAGK